MRQHQFPQLAFAKDGIPLHRPYWSAIVNVAPGERYSVLLQLEDPRGLGLALSHPHPRGERRRNVWNGDGLDRQGAGEPERGVEPLAYSLRVNCSTTELPRRGL